MGYERIKQTSINFVQAMKLDTGIYSKEAGDGPSMYGTYHAAHILDLFGAFPHQETDIWAEVFHQRQTPQGYFVSKPELSSQDRGPYDLDPVWHSTRGSLWTLRILDRKPVNDLTFMEPFLDAKMLYDWVKHYDWSNPWAASNQVLACVTGLLGLRDWFGVAEVDAVMEQGMYPALEELLDETTGYWGTQFGADLYSGQFGTIHISPIYFAQGWPLRALERNIDSTLATQLPDGSFWPGGSDCPDFDGAYMMANLAELTDYRREDLETAARKYLDHALMHEDPDGVGWRLHRRDSQPSDWKPRPHFIWPEGATVATEELRDDDPDRTHIMLGSWFYPLSIALIAHMLGDTGYEGPYRLNRMSLHECNAFTSYAIQKETS